MIFEKYRYFLWHIQIWHLKSLWMHMSLGLAWKLVIDERNTRKLHRKRITTWYESRKVEEKNELCGQSVTKQKFTRPACHEYWVVPKHTSNVTNLSEQLPPPRSLSPLLFFVFLLFFLPCGLSTPWVLLHPPHSFAWLPWWPGLRRCLNLDSWLWGCHFSEEYALWHPARFP